MPKSSCRGKTARIPVRLFNMSARVVTVLPKSNLCDLQEVKVLRSPSVTEKKDYILETANVNQQIVSDQDQPDNPFGEDLGDSVLTVEQKEQVRHFINKWEGIFSKSCSTDLGRTNLIEREIHLEDDQPFKEPYRRIPPALIQEVREHLNEMLEIGAIRESKSPFSSNVVIVRKKDGTIRFSIDYRKLNQRTVKDAYAIPRIDDTLHLLAGSKYFSTLDLKKWLLAGRAERRRQSKDSLSGRYVRLLRVKPHAIWLVQRSSQFSEIDGKMYG